MPHLAAPQWLLFLPAFALLAWRWPRLVLWKPLRATCLILLALYLARPELRMSIPGMDLWVLEDRSASTAEALGPRLPEIERLLEAGRGANDRLFFVDFASAPVQRQAGTAFEPSTDATRFRLALEYTLAKRDPKRAVRLLAVTDGFSTESLDGLDDALKKAGVPLDVRWEASPANDARLTGLTVPARVQPGEGFLLEINGLSPQDGEIPYEVFSDGERIGQGSMAFTGGRGAARIATRSLRPGAHRYEVRLLSNDARQGNNVASAWVEVVSGPSVLLISAYPDDPLADVLRGGGYTVELVTDPKTLQPGLLTGPRVVVFNNVPAHRVPAPFLEALDFFVREQGGGLLMAGGRLSFGAGGYFESPVDPLLPVSMELKEEHRKLAVAMAIVLDRSGSMAAGAGPGVTKMDLANEGAARAIELLGPSDAVTVLAVDSEPHEIVPLVKVAGSAAQIGEKVRRIQSAGGGIFVYKGLEAAWKELQKSKAGQRHTILFADAADAEEPGAYRELLLEMTGQGATVSVIGLGSSTDSDAAFLEDVAARGKGRIFFNADPSQLPALFAQETVAIARSAFLTEPTGVTDAGGWREISAQPLQWLKTVDAYNLSYLRPEATAIALSTDEYQAPLVASWVRGAGRAAAICFPLAGELSESFRAWPQAADFERTMIRWLLPAAPPAGTSLRTRVVGEDLIVELLCDEAWTRKFAEHPPRLVTAVESGTPSEIPWEKVEPGRYLARTALPATGWVRGVVQAGSEHWSFGPISTGLDPEWDTAPEKQRAFRDLSKASGGRDINDLREAWQRPPRQDVASLQIAVLIALLLVFLAEVAITRWRGVA